MYLHLLAHVGNDFLGLLGSLHFPTHLDSSQCKEIAFHRDPGCFDNIGKKTHRHPPGRSFLFTCFVPGNTASHSTNNTTAFAAQSNVVTLFQYGSSASWQKKRKKLVPYRHNRSELHEQDHYFCKGHNCQQLLPFSLVTQPQTCSNHICFASGQK